MTDNNHLLEEVIKVRSQFAIFEYRLSQLEEEVNKYHLRLHDTENTAGKSEVDIERIFQELRGLKSFAYGEDGKGGANIQLDRFMNLFEESRLRSNQNRTWLLGLTSGVILLALGYFLGR